MQMIDEPSANTTKHLYYRLLGVSGSVSGEPYLFEVEFRGGT